MNKPYRGMTVIPMSLLKQEEEKTFGMYRALLQCYEGCGEALTQIERLEKNVARDYYKNEKGSREQARFWIGGRLLRLACTYGFKDIKYENEHVWEVARIMFSSYSFSSKDKVKKFHRILKKVNGEFRQMMAESKEA